MKIDGIAGRLFINIPLCKIKNAAATSIYTHTILIKCA